MESDNNPVLRFVSVDQSTEKHLQRASEASKEYELDSEWISASELGNLDLEARRSVFVLENFRGDSFEYLKKHNCRIVGPQCILSCLQTQTSLPNVQCPVYSVAMRDAAVCCTSVPKQERERLSELIQLMGGIVMKDFTSSVTHLVAGEVGSKKYRVACSFNKPILLPEWVDKCWELCCDKHICAMDEEFMQYTCPIFKGITLCVTGIDGEIRREIKKLVTQHGGTYSGELNMNTCTHLLVDTPRGEKYDFARRWNLHCVCSQWFFDSIQSGFCLDESHYYMLPDDENNSSQAGTRLSRSLMKSNGGKSSAEKKIASKAAQAAHKSAQKHGDKDLMSTSGRKSINQSRNLDNVSRLAETRISADHESSDFDVTIQPGNMFLDGCKIYLSGFSGLKLEKLRKIINCGGGTRFNQINEIVSHVIVGDKVDADVELLRNCEFQVFVVNVQWILDSAKEGKKLGEEKYLCSDLINKEELSTSCKENEDPEEPPKNTTVPQQKLPDNNKNTRNAKSENDAFEDDDDDDDVFQQYMPQNIDKASTSEPNPPKTNTIEEKKETPSTSADPDATLYEEDEPEQDGLLCGKSFTITGFATEHVAHLWQLIESNGGRPVAKGQTADYEILPMNTIPEEKCQAKQLVTFCWLQQSVECGHLLALDDSFLFTPFSIPAASQPLKGCVLSISQYTGVERDHMFQLAEILGATCQEYFVRKASNNYQASTHLLCRDPDGNKYKAAVKWNIPVVSREWLFACATNGTLVPINRYPVDKSKTIEEDDIEDAEEENVTKDELNSKEDAQEVNARTAQEEIPMETNDVEEVPEETTDVSNHESAQKKPVKRPSIYNRPFRPSFDLADVMEELASPACQSLRRRKSRASRNSFPLDDFFAENIKQTLQKIGTVAPPTNAGEDKLDDDDVTTDDIQQVESPLKGILAGIILSVSKKLAQQQTELFTLATSLGADYRWLYDDSCTHLIHQGSNNDKTKEYTQAKDHGIYIVSPHWLYICQEKNERVDETMYPHTFNPKLSLPVVTTGRRVTRSSRASTMEHMSPRKKGKSPTAKTGDSGEQNSAEQSSKTSNGPDEVAAAEQGVAEGAATEVEQVQQDPQMGPATLESLEAREDFKRQLEAIMDATKAKGRRRSRRHTSSTNSSNVSHNASGNTTAEMSLATRRTSSRLRSRISSKASEGGDSSSSSRVKTRSLFTDDSEHSQSDCITYDDPAGRMEREKIMAQLKRGCSPSPDFHTEDEEDERRHNDTRTSGQSTVSKDSLQVTGITITRNNPTVERHVRELSVTVRSDPPSPMSSSTPVAPPIGLQIKDTLKPQPVNLLEGTEVEHTPTRALTTPKFQLSVMTPQEKIDYSALIEQLGGQVFDSGYFNPECTHVVVGKPNRNEKYLAAVAAGLWVLHKSYLEASREAGFFVDEAPHEWGQEIPGEPPNKLASAARRWRLRLRQERAVVSEPTSGAFSGWMVLLCVDKSRQPGFKRLLESGGAKVSGIRPPFKNTQDYTHAFLDVAKTKVEASDLNLLQRDNVWCLKPDYIAEYLMQDPPPPPQKYLLPELVTPAEQDKQGLSLSRKRKGDDISGVDKRARV